MKRLLLTLLIAALPLLAQAKKGILRYEYSDGESYYTLEIDTLGVDTSKHGRLCVHYVDWGNITVETVELTLNGRIGRSNDTHFVFTPWAYTLYEHSRYLADSWNFPQWGFTLEEPFEENNGFFFWYDAKDDWQRLEYGYYHFDEDNPNEGYYSIYLHPQTLNMSPFFRAWDHVEWFPPYFTRVKKFDYDRFPEDAKREIKKRRLK